MHRDFDATLAAAAGEKPTFVVGGQTFTAKAKLPHRKFARLLDALRADDMTEEAGSELFFSTVLVKDDRQRFLDLLDADDDDDDGAHAISSTQLNAITEWLMEWFTGKPQTNSDSSSNGATDTAPPRNVVSLNPRAS